MTTQPNTARRLVPDRGTAVSLTLFVIAILVLMALIGFITRIPAQTITDTIQNQATEQQKLRAASLARQVEGYFNILANSLIGLSNRPAVQSMTGLRADALRALAEVGEEHAGQIAAIVRIGRDGTPRYAWPEAYNALVDAGQPLPWTVDAAWVNSVVEGRGVQLLRRSSGTEAAYVLAMPLTAGLNIVEVIAFEVDIQGYLEATFRALDLGEMGQLWVLDRFGSQLFQFRPEPQFSGGTAQLINLTDTELLARYPTEDRESVAVPIYTAFTQSRSRAGSLVLILSRTYAEVAQITQNTLQTLALFSLGVIAFVALFGLLVVSYLLRESNRRRHAENRRMTANMLLDMSQTINSSLNLNIVLGRILENLGKLLPHDNASILLLSEDKQTATIAAESGSYTPDNKRAVIKMTDLRAARDVLAHGRPTVINDTRTDPRWEGVPGSNIVSWLGVPLRVRDEPVGVLNINSQNPNFFTMDDADLVKAFADQAGVAIQNARAHELEIRVYEAELETARAIQASLLPQEQPPFPQVEVAARFVPARHVSGDYYQYFLLPGNKLGIAVGDVSGKGIPAALLMAVVSTALRDEILRLPAPAGLLTELNQRLFSRMQQNKMNTALLVAIFDPETHCLEVASAGMLSPYARSKNGWSEIELSGYPLGLALNTTYRSRETEIERGATVVFLSDGVIEAQNASRELLGYERFEALLDSLPFEATADEVADSILNAVHEHLAGDVPGDDITIVVLRSLEG